MKPTHLDLFSGIGGFTLAAQEAGFETIGFSEIEPYACKVLKRHWPDITNYGDVRTIPTVRCDLITGGFPCQPHSVAGKRRGSKDDRHLWPAMRDVIGRCKPTWVCGENVLGIIGVELNKVLSDLESLGYRVQPIVVPACAVDAPHRRDRVWIVANSSGGRFTVPEVRKDEQSWRTETIGSGEVVADTDQSRPQGRNGEKLREGGTEWIAGAGGASMGDSMRQGLHAATQAGIHCGEEVARARDVEPERSSEWLPEPAVGRVAHGIPNRSHRLKGLGNAIVPQVAQVILQAIRVALT